MAGGSEMEKKFGNDEGDFSFKGMPKLLIFSSSCYGKSLTPFLFLYTMQTIAL
jgi:hypothetical protein